VVEMAIIYVIWSMEDEHLFSSVGFLKFKLQKIFINTFMW